MVGGKEFEEAIANARFFFVDDGVARGIQQNVRLDEAGERNNLPVQLQRVSHGQRIRMARYGNNVFGAKYVRLFENFTADFGEREPVGCRVEAFQASGVLNRLQSHAAHARLLRARSR